MPTEPLTRAKLRRSMRAWRAGLDPASAARWSAQASAQLRALALLDDATTIAAFMPHGLELDLREAYSAWLAAGRTLVMPRIMGPGLMTMAPIVDLDASLEVGPYGIFAPRASALSLEAVDAVIAPALALDRFGGRLGMGGGFYDRWLARWLIARPDASHRLIGAVYEAQILDAPLPVAPHDVPMRCLLSERGACLVAARSQIA